MNDEEYIQVQQQLLCFAAIVKDMPLSEFLQRISTCETVAPLVDPILFMKGIVKLTCIKKIAEGAMSFQNAIVECERSLKEAVK